MQQVQCRDCGNRVLVEKFSPQHTSVQWTSSSAACPEFAAAATNSAMIPACLRLRESIDRAVADGRVDVGPS